MMMEFLYFPEDKSEYIPAFIMLVIFMVGAIATMYLFYKKSKKEEKLFDEHVDDHPISDEMFKNNNSNQKDY